MTVWEIGFADGHGRGESDQRKPCRPPTGMSLAGMNLHATGIHATFRPPDVFVANLSRERRPGAAVLVGIVRLRLHKHYPARNTKRIRRRLTRMTGLGACSSGVRMTASRHPNSRG